MHITCLTPWLSRSGAGVTESVRNLCRELSRNDSVRIDVAGICDRREEVDMAYWHPIQPVACDRSGPRALGFSCGMGRQLRELNSDLLHTHSLWQFTSWNAIQWGRRCDKPYVVSPHGMLDAWAFNRSRWKKRLAMLCYESRHLRNAACIHALNEHEYNCIRELGLENPVAIIPNGVRVEECGKLSRLDSGFQLLYLGRIHEKKGLGHLLEAWSLFLGGRSTDWRLVIAGWDDGGCERGLRMRAEELGLSSSVSFVGPKFGAEKRQLLQEATAFVLPSLSEGLPIVILEAWANRLPVLMTEQCNLPEGFEIGAALPIAPSVDGILSGLSRLNAMTDSPRDQMGQRCGARQSAICLAGDCAADVRSLFVAVEWGSGTELCRW